MLLAVVCDVCVYVCFKFFLIAMRVRGYSVWLIVFVFGVLYGRCCCWFCCGVCVVVA